MKRLIFSVSLLTLASILILSCSGISQHAQGDTNTSLVVTYNGKEVHRRNTNWVSAQELDNIVKIPGEKVFIFGADWCKACGFLRKALKQADLDLDIHWISVDDPWGAKLMQVLRKNSIPYMIYLDKNGNTVAEKVGPSEITMYLLLK